LKFASVEPKRKQALLRSNLPGIGSPDKVSFLSGDNANYHRFLMDTLEGKHSANRILIE
jgi:hypothetical protein